MLFYYKHYLCRCLFFSVLCAPLGFLTLCFTHHFLHSHLCNILAPLPPPHTQTSTLHLPPAVTVLRAGRLSATASVDIKAFAVSKVDERQEEGGRGQARVQLLHTAANTAKSSQDNCLEYLAVCL